ncbi:MAG TPA: hypothetical protein VFL14_15620 [Xanthomonadales bacterium]|nr:hypothetical protein [Xanthomonadales bacterium]
MRVVSSGSTFACLALLGLATGAPAQALYKCRAPDGSLSYQDHACDADAEELVPPAIAPPPRDPYVPKLPQREPVGAPVADVAPPPRPSRPLPRLYHCYKPEGGEYTSESPNLQPRQVPLWTMDRYSPTFGRGLGASGALYTTVVDQCRVLGRAETCAHVRKRLDEAEHDRRLAFNDTRDALEGEVADLREVIAANCL